MQSSTVICEPTRSGLCNIGGAQLYYELRGRGPALLFIPGASGDGGSFEVVASRLADAYAVLTYDRRAHSRSPRPAGWSQTTLDEQADDAASLLSSLGLAPAHVFGVSSGATIGLNLTLRHPQVVRSAVLHEPPKIGVMPERDKLLGDLRARMEAVRLRGGYRAAMADFIGWMSDSGQGNAGTEKDPVMQRILGNGEVWLNQELGVVDRYDPPSSLMKALRVPITVSVGSEGGTALHQQLLQRYADSLQQLAERVGGRLHRLPGAHMPYRTHPEQLAVQLRVLLS